MAGLALAQSIVAAGEVLILFVIMWLRDHKLFDRQFWVTLCRTISVSGFCVVAGYAMINLYPLGANDKGILRLAPSCL